MSKLLCASAPKAGLNAIERRQTHLIAKKVIKNTAETKYFDCKTIDQLSGINYAGIIPTPARLAYPQLYVVGFASGSNNVGATSLSYGQNTMEEILHGRIFPDGQANGQDIDGQYVTPSLAMTTFDIQRVVFTSDLTLSLARNSVPFMVRVLRLVPKPAKGSNQSVDPERDAFLSEKNQEIGVSNTNFQHYHLLMLKANNRKYTVKQDFRFMLNPPLTATEGVNAGGVSSYSVENISRGCHKQMTFRHDIGKKLFYDDPNTRSQPDDGFKNEYMLFHIIPVGTENDGSIIPTTVRFGAKAVSTFKDL